jgi:hypothetical protein
MSMGEVDIEIQAIDDASEVIATVQNNLNQLGTSANITAGNMSTIGTASTTTGATMQSNIGAITSVTSGFMALGLSVFGAEKAQVALDRANLIVEKDTEAVRKAQVAYNDAIAKYGPSSQQATDAATKLSLAQGTLTVATERQDVAQQNQTMSLISIAAFGIPGALTALSRLPQAYTAIQQIGSKVTGMFGEQATSAGLSAEETASAADVIGDDLAPAAVQGTAATGGLMASLGTIVPVAGALIVAGRGVVATAGEMWTGFTQGTESAASFGNQMMTMENPLLNMAQGVESFAKDLGLIPQQVPSVSAGLGMIQAAAVSAGSAISSSLSGAWATVSSEAQSAFAGIMSAVAGFGSQITSTLSGAWAAIATGAQSAWASLTSGAAAMESTLSSGISSALSSVGSAWSGFWSSVESAASSAASSIVSAFSSMAGEMESSIQGALDSIVSSFQNTVNQLTSDAQNLWNQMVGHSIWTDMLTTMEDQTTTTLGNITNAFKGMATQIPVTIAPIVGNPSSGSGFGAAANLGSSSSGSGLVAVGPVNVNLQNQTNLQVDGRTLTSLLEQRLIQQRLLSSAYKAT